MKCSMCGAKLRVRLGIGHRHLEGWGACESHGSDPVTIDDRKLNKAIRGACIEAAQKVLDTWPQGRRARK